MKIKQAIAIEGATLTEYVNAYNEAMLSIAGCEITAEQNISALATIVYYIKSDAKTTAPECKGNCESCAYFRYKLDRFGEIDRRYKFGTCEATDGAHVNKNMRACDMYRERR